MMGKFKDLTGQRFGKLVVLQFYKTVQKSGVKRHLWLCQCDCGNTHVVLGNSLSCNKVLSCGCSKGTPNKFYSIGDVSICLIFGRGRSGYFWFDTEDFDLLSGYNWHIDNDGYAVAYERGSGAKHMKNIRVAKLILGIPHGDSNIKNVDHINGDRCDNRKCNLRVCTRAENVHHKRGVRGYTQLPNLKYYARIVVNGKPINLGIFNTAEEAQAAYRAASVLYHKDFCVHDGYTYYPGCYEDE